MDEKIGCVWGVVGLIFIVAILWVGGNQRTEMTFTPPGTENLSGQVQFEETLNARHWLGGLIKGQQPDLQLVMGKHLRPGDQLTRLTIITKHTFWDFFLAVITIGIYTPVTVNVQGSIARPG